MWTAENADLSNVKDATIDNILNPLNTAEILKCIAELPLGYRTVFNLFAIEGFSHQEIAQQLGISESTSKTQFLKSKLRLQQKIEALEKTGIA
jgi:RNA polymerase sigma-70 factor (ECF subfamily)